MWQPLQHQLHGRELITFDLPGCGLSPPAKRPMRIRALADVVAELITTLGHPTVDTLGYSFGGVIAQELAIRAPARIRRLILCATSPGWPSMPPNPLAAVLMLSPARYYNRQLAKIILPVIAGGRTARDQDTLLSELRQRLAHPPSLLGYTQQLYAISGWSSLTWLHRLEHPTLLVHGSDDPLVPLINARCMARRIPNATLHVVERAGHLLLFDDTQHVAPSIKEFLAGP